MQPPQITHTNSILSTAKVGPGVEDQIKHRPKKKHTSSHNYINSNQKKWENKITEKLTKLFPPGRKSPKVPNLHQDNNETVWSVKNSKSITLTVVCDWAPPPCSPGPVWGWLTFPRRRPPAWRALRPCPPGLVSPGSAARSPVWPAPAQSSSSPAPPEDDLRGPLFSAPPTRQEVLWAA